MYPITKEKKQEYNKRYYNKNKENISNDKKEYYEDNKEILINKSKEYYENNKLNNTNIYRKRSKETYNKIRIRGNYEQVHKNIENFLKIK